jgi:hypothetical protein
MIVCNSFLFKPKLFFFQLVSEKVLSSNFIYVIYLLFQLNIVCVGPHLLRESVGSHLKESVEDRSLQYVVLILRSGLHPVKRIIGHLH